MEAAPLLLTCVLVFFNVFGNIWAQSCVTPNGENAKCVSIYSCNILYDAVTTTDPEVKRFLQASQCGFDETPLVCCGTRASYTPKATVKPRLRPVDTLNHRNAVLLPDRRTCGYQDSQDRVLNGQATYITEFPWMALLRYRNDSGFEQFSCGGTLINSRYVLTAAHCVVGKIRRRIGLLKTVRLGEWNIDTDPDCFTSRGFRVCSEKPIDVPVEDFVAHADYNDNSIDRYNDIALVRLSRSVKFSKYVHPICLPTSSLERTDAGATLVVVGWGKTERSNYSPVKQKLALPVVDMSQCRTKFRAYSVNLEDSQLCAGGIKDKDSCTGDSGGPLLGTSKNDSSQYYIEGIVSFGATCGADGFPGIYTRVSEFLTWILTNMKQ